MKFYLLASMLLLSIFSTAQASVIERKGKWSFHYGYNRASYSESDYYLKGNNYNFNLENVRATDTPTPFQADPYLLPWAWSVPQNNVHFSYFLTDTLAISFGNDHMKYKMVGDQTVAFDGYINTGEGFDRSGPGTQKLTGDFLKFEHTDGLNYVNVELEQYIDLWLSKDGKQAFSIYWGPGIGFMFPKTNSELFGRARNDEFKVAGWGTSIKLAGEYNYHEWFIRVGIKFGYIDMFNASTTSSSSDTLAHKFDFTQVFSVFGLYY